MSRSPALPVPATATWAAPHVRDAVSVASVARTATLALVPCLLAGAHGTGRQIHLAVGAGGSESAGWRGDLFAALGLTADPSDVLACTAHGLLYAVPLLAVSFAVTGAAEYAFARVRRRPLVPGTLLVALLFTLAVPVTLPLWQAAVSLGFGVVVGKELFGGTGRNVVHPAVAAVTFLALAWPESWHGDGVWVPVAGEPRPAPFDRAVAGGVGALAAGGVGWLDTFAGGQPGSLGASSPAACLLGGAFLWAKRMLSWRTVIAVFLGVVAGAWSFRQGGLGHGPAAEVPGTWHLVLGSVVFGAVFLATDPVTSPLTNAGRWIHGLLLGGVVVMIRVGNPNHPEGTYLALLLGSIFAPLNDSVVVWAHLLRRRRRG